MSKTTSKQWIQSVIRKGRKGALSRQLSISVKENIPVALLRTIKYADIGETIHNPTAKGKSWIKVTRLLKRRAVLAMTLKEWKK